MIDSHTHLNDPKLFEDWKTYLENFEKIGWSWLVNVWTGDEWNKKAILIAKEAKNIFSNLKIWATIGFHPETVASWDIKKQDFEKKIFELEKLYLENKDYIWALGEFGLDSHYDQWVSISDQMEFFDMQMSLAKKLSLPVVIHSRDEIDKTLEILKNYKDQKIYLHCWTYNLEALKKTLNVLPEYYIGFTGIATYKNAWDIQEALKYFWVNERLLLETDAPYLAPVPMRWKTNQPAFVDYVYDFVSGFLEIEKEKLVSKVKKNFEEFYNL